MKFSTSYLEHISSLLLVIYTGSIMCPLLPARAAENVRPVADTSWKAPAVVRSRPAMPNVPTPVSPPEALASLPSVPTHGDLRKFRALGRLPSEATLNQAPASEKGAYARLLENYAAHRHEPVSIKTALLTNHLAAQPDSSLSTTLWAEVASNAESSGQFALAFTAGMKVWDATKAATVAAGRADEVDLAEESLARLLSVSTRTGRKAALESLLAQAHGRAVHVKSAAALAGARQMLDWWKTSPAANIQCGLTAYNVIAEKLGKPLLSRPAQHWGPAEAQPPNDEVERQEFIARGMSAARLLKRINEAGGDFIVVKRMSGAEVPVPAVAHFQFEGGEGHYSAVMAADDSSVTLSDPFLRIEGRMEAVIFNAQASGYFLVPASSNLPAGFRVAETAEAQAVYGRQCVSGKGPDKCNSPRGDCGMPVYALAEFMPSVLISDRPLTYEPAYGPALDFSMVYRQVLLDHTDDLSQSSHLGPHWFHSFLSYIRAENAAVGLPASASEPMRWVTSEGTFWKFTQNGAAWSTDYTGSPTLSTRVGGGYKLTFLDGSVIEFAQPNSLTAATRYYVSKIMDADGLALTLTYDANYRLSQVQDATGKITSFSYTGTSTRINSITDPYSRTASFGYNAEGMLSSVTDALGIISTFGYDASQPQLVTSMTTPYGTTQFVHEGTPNLNFGTENDWSVAAIDPEGLTEKMETYYYHNSDPSLDAAQYPPSPITVGGVNVTVLRPGESSAAPGTFADAHHQVSYHWTKKYWREYQKAKALDANVDPHQFAHATMWLMDTSNQAQPVPLGTRDPGLAITWYNYPGQTHGSFVGSGNSPSLAVRKIEDSTGTAVWTVTQQTYSTLGQPAIYTDEVGRKSRQLHFTTSYTNNATWGTTVANRDVQYDQVWNGSSWLTVRTYGKYANGVPGTVTEISGRITTTTRNAKQQVTEVAVSKSTNIEKTRYTYDADGQGTPDGQPGYLMKVERTSNTAGTTWATLEEYTYDTHGRKATETDASGYTRSFDYDAFDRVSLITYPDTTTDQFSYLRGEGAGQTESLDITASKDRANRWTQTLYNPRRQPIIQLTPDGKTTRFDWCSCGSLYKLTDPAGRVTEWKRDILGRVTEKVMPDGTTKTSYTYEQRSGRLSTMTRPNEQGTGSPTVTYRYFTNGLLQKEDYVGTDTPDVTYTYDVINRLDIATTTGLGNHDHAYEALTSGTVGAGQIASINGPFSHDTVSRGYDWQDRHNNTVLASDTPTTLRAETRTWDTLGRLKTINSTSGNTGLGTFTFNYTTNLNRVDSITAPQSLVTNYTYFPNSATGTKAQRLESITHTRSGVQYSKNVYDYDPAGRITSWAKEQTTTAAENSVNSFGYNPSDEVTAYRKALASAPTTVVDQQDWAYDNAGNWLSTGTPAAMSTRTHNSLNQLTQVGGAGSTVVAGTLNEFAEVTVNSQPAELRSDPVNGGYQFSKKVNVAEGSNTLTVQATDKDTPPNTTTQNYTLNVGGLSRSFSYDANGNLLSDGDRTFTWDAKNRLLTVTVGGTRYRWQYDYRDRRVKEFKKVGAAAETTEKIFFWHENDLIMERNGANTATLRTYHHGGFQEGNPTVATNAKYLTTTDHLGNVREVIAANTGAGTIGDVKARYDYTVFQGPVKLSGTVDASLLTIGRYYHHAATGLELALYRAYDPVLGRWLSEDPIEERGGINYYKYNDNTPTAKIDKLGLSSDPFEYSPWRGGNDKLGPGPRTCPQPRSPGTPPIGGGGGGAAGLAALAAVALSLFLHYPEYKDCIQNAATSSGTWTDFWTAVARCMGKACTGGENL